MNCWKEKYLYTGLWINAAAWRQVQILPQCSGWCFALDRSHKMVPSPSLHHPVPPKSLTHVKARNSKQNSMFVYIDFWINTSVFILISKTLRSLHGLTTAARAGLSFGIFINTGHTEAGGICPGYHITAWCNHKATVRFTCTVAPDSHRMWLFFLPACPWVWKFRLLIPKGE